MIKNLYNNEYVNVYCENSDVYIKIIKPGFALNQLMAILEKHDEIVYDYHLVANIILKKSSGDIVKIGAIKEKIEISVTHDLMKAYVKYNYSENELESVNREKLIIETALKLKENGIVYGVKSDFFLSELSSGVEYVIAEGLMPEHGNDSQVRYFELKEVKPEVIESEKCDYYNLSLIQTVGADAWLGERIEATEGKNGSNILGETLIAKNGVTLPLYYDKEYIYEKREGEKTVLYAKAYGAVYFKGASISLMNPLVINGDVDFKTGNINFDGHVIINGTICDGFYVEATGNIEVNGELGLGNIKGIVSRNGSIFVKGGLLCKGNITLKAEKNVYVKFIENASIICGGTAHIGFYCANSIINAREVVVDSANGKIFGGSIKASTRIVSPVIGSEMGKRTIIEVTCFDRETVKAQIDLLINKIESLKNEYSQVKQKISSYTSKGNLSSIQDRILNDAKERFKSIFDELKTLNDEKDNFNYFYKTRGDGEINAIKRVYENTAIIMKNKTMEITSTLYTMAFVYQGGRIIQI